MLIRSQGTTLLQIFCDLLLYSQVIFKGMRVADDTLERNSKCEWVNSFSCGVFERSSTISIIFEIIFEMGCFLLNNNNSQSTISQNIALLSLCVILLQMQGVNHVYYTSRADSWFWLVKGHGLIVMISSLLSDRLLPLTAHEIVE